ncbi:MAG: sensor histidine kinase [Polaribacter sp.]
MITIIQAFTFGDEKRMNRQLKKAIHCISFCVQNSKKQINYSDSLQILEQKVQHKSVQIAHKTDKYIAENKCLSKEKKWFLTASFGFVSVFALLCFIKVQKIKDEKLLVDAALQKASEQIYFLTLKQQEKLEKEKIKERNRIAEELHDGILAKLFGARVSLGFLEFKKDKKMNQKYQFYLDELQSIEKEIRDVSHKLSDNFEDFKIGFPTMISQLLENKSEIGGFTFKLAFDDRIRWEFVNKITKINLYRIIQEAIQNSMKHASATHIAVRFSLNKTELALMVKDNGCGFNVKRKAKGIGLKHIKSRTKKLKGICRIYSQLNKGTIIKINIPIQ